MADTRPRDSVFDHDPAKDAYLGSAWHQFHENYIATWKREGSSNRFSAVFSVYNSNEHCHYHITARLEIRINAQNDVTVLRTNSSDGSDGCYYGKLLADGTIVGNGFSSERFTSTAPWGARIL